MNRLFLCFTFFCAGIVSSFSQEEIFADYFDIKTNSPEGTFVTGKIHLKSNKDVLTTVIPENYDFIIKSDPSNLFELVSRREDVGKMKGLLIGDIKVKSGAILPSSPIDYTITIALNDGFTDINMKNITVKVVDKTIWEHLVDYYGPVSVSEGRLYGRTKLSDEEIESYITEINANNGQLKSVNDVYNTNHENIPNLNNQWIEIANILGAFGYAYSDDESSYYQSSVLRRAIYKGAREYMNNFPVFGDDILSPIGNEIGDGYQGLYQNGQYLSYGQVTHQWTTFDPLGAPLVQIAKHVLADVESGDSEALALQESIFRFYQSFFAIVPNKRAIDNPDDSWGDISDINYSNGAWTDANISHRMRTLMVMGVVWGDYNRPITYVPYWYDDYHDGTENEGSTFARGWSPRGVVNDIRNWCDKFSTTTKLYGQSGFHPDGTISHHVPYGGSDVAMRSYGFEWLDEINVAIPYFINTPVPIQDSGYQFLADRINYTYRRLLYKQYLDYVVVGRSYYSPLQEFTTKDINRSVYKLVNNKSQNTVIENEAELVALNNNLQNNTHQHSESVAFWNADYLVHRVESNQENYFFSVKQKSIRVSGAEDFESIRKTWHAGSGVFQLKVDGHEYSQSVLKEYDWHMLPGVTEEWRTDPMPTGHASYAGIGLNEYSGVLVNQSGTYGMSSFYYDPTPALYNIPNSKLDQLPEYAAATAYKSAHLIGNMGTALGSEIRRKIEGQGKNIYTCIDQSKHDATIYYKIGNNDELSISAGQSVDLMLDLTAASWVFHENKGYLIFPKNNNQQLKIQTGDFVNVTDTTVSTSSNYILGLSHGVDPDEDGLDGYHYVLVADVDKSDLTDLLETYQADVKTFIQNGVSHVVYDTSKKVVEASFFQPGTVNLSQNDWIKTDSPCMVIREDAEYKVTLSLTDAMHDLSSSSISIEIPQLLAEGTYNYNFKGIEMVSGETAEVVETENGSRIIFEMPDYSDAVFYDYKEQMMAGAPVSIAFPKKVTISVDEHFLSSNIEVYPVPVSKETVVKVSDKVNMEHVECFDMFGRLVYKKTMPMPIRKLTLNLDKYISDSSFFVLKVTTNHGVYKKILVSSNYN